MAANRIPNAGNNMQRYSMFAGTSSCFKCGSGDHWAKDCDCPWWMWVGEKCDVCNVGKCSLRLK